MIFRVSDDYRGSVVLATVGKALSAGMTVSISTENVVAPDVKAAIRQKILIPLDQKKYDSDFAGKNSEAMLVNLTGKVMVLGQIVLRPWASLLVDRKMAADDRVISASQKGLIHVLTEDVSYVAKPTTSQSPTPVSSEPEETTPDEFETKVEDSPKEEPFVIGEDRKVQPTVWDFREKKSVNAQFVPKNQEMTMLTKDDSDEVDFVDAEKAEEDPPAEEAPKRAKKKTAKKASGKKKASKKATKKKETASETPKDKDQTMTVVEASAVRAPDKKADVPAPRGRKVGDELQNILNSLGDEAEIDFVDREGGAPADVDFIDSKPGDNEIGFVDQEQQQERVRQRQKE
jgi:hypothetical protein